MSVFCCLFFTSPLKHTPALSYKSSFSVKYYEKSELAPADGCDPLKKFQGLVRSYSLKVIHIFFYFLLLQLIACGVIIKAYEKYYAIINRYY